MIKRELNDLKEALPFVSKLISQMDLRSMIFVLQWTYNSL